MDVLQTAILRAKLAKHAPIVDARVKRAPKIKPPTPAAAALIEIATLPIDPPPLPAGMLPGIAPWRDEPRIPLAPRPRIFTIREVIAVVAAHFQMTWQEITGPCRDRRLVAARHIAQFLCVRLTTRSTPMIGRAFDNRDHSTIVNACKRIRARIESDPDTRELVERLEARIRGIAPNSA